MKKKNTFSFETIYDDMTVKVDCRYSPAHRDKLRETPDEEAFIEIEGFIDNQGNELDLFDDEDFCEKCIEMAWDVWEGKNDS